MAFSKPKSKSQEAKSKPHGTAPANDNSAAMAEIDWLIAEESAKETPQEKAETERQMKIAKKTLKEEASLLRRLADL